MHELRLLNVLSLSHARAAAGAVCANALSRALLFCVCVCAGSLFRFALSLSITGSRLTPLRKICSFCPIFLVAKRKFNIFLLCLSVFVIISMNLNA